MPRQNRRRPEERSAIDFVMTTYGASQWVRQMIIDEEGKNRLGGMNETDHNTITLDVEVKRMQHCQVSKRTDWNYKADEMKWDKFRDEIHRSTSKSKSIMADKSKEITIRYSKWEQLLYKACIASIGRTTFKTKEILKPSNQLRRLQKERRQLKKEFEQESVGPQKKAKLEFYLEKQKQV